METTEKYQFMDEELKGLWPGWQPTEAETRVWLGVLNKYDCDTARKAIQNYFADLGGNYRRPKPAGFIAKANVILQRKSVNKERPTLMTSYYIECIEGPERNPKVKGARRGVFVADTKKQDDPDYVLACAETMRKKFEQLYGGQWITVKVKPIEDSGLMGIQARDKAFADILNGPDTKTKRWLQEYLGNKYEKPAEQKEIKQPALIGDVLDDVPF